MMWTLVRFFVPYLSRDYREALLEYDKEIQGTKTAKPRWLHCIEELNSYYPVSYTHLTLPTNREV